jgi:hypothetical protein
MEVLEWSNGDDFCRVRTTDLRSLNSCGHCLEQRYFDGRTVMIVVL